MKIADRSNITLEYSFVQSTFWMTYGTSLSFASVYLLGLSYSNSELGLILALGNLSGALLGPMLSDQIDRSKNLGAADFIPWALAAQMLSLILILLRPVRSPLSSIGYTLYIALALTVNSLNLKLYSDAIHSGWHINYGFTRGVGSASFVVLSMLLGVLVERFSVRLIPLAGVLLCLVQFVAFTVIRRRIPHVSSARKEEKDLGAPLPEFIRSNPRFTVLLLGSAVLFLSYKMCVNFMINIARNVGGDTSTMGFLNAFTATLEIPVMMLYQRLFSKRNPAVLLAISFICFSLKAIAVALAGSVPALAAALLFQPCSFALYSSAIVLYVDRFLPYQDSAKAQSLAFTMTTVGAVLSSIVGGALFDRIGVSATLWVTVAASLVGTAVSLLGIERRRSA